MKSSVSNGNTGVFLNPKLRSGLLYCRTRPPAVFIIYLKSPGEELREVRPLCYMGKVFSLLPSVGFFFSLSVVLVVAKWSNFYGLASLRGYDEDSLIDLVESGVSTLFIVLGIVIAKLLRLPATFIVCCFAGALKYIITAAWLALGLTKSAFFCSLEVFGFTLICCN